MREKFLRWIDVLKREGMTLWFCCRHPRMPCLPKIFALLVVGYFLSPIDLIPDFIPLIGYLDDLILLPAGIYLVLKLVPAPVLADCRAQAAEWMASRRPKPRSIAAAIVILLLWVALCAWLWHLFGEQILRFSGLR